MPSVSILQTERKCYVCGGVNNLALHHCIYGTGKRALSEREGLTIWLCYKHHNGSDDGVHFNKELDLRIKQMAQQEWLSQHNNNLDQWMKIFRRNYL